MGVPKRHHYLPQFYQRRWATGGSAVVYRRFPSGLSILKKPPSAIGFFEDLYANPTEPDVARRQLLESRVFGRIDNDASVVLRSIENSGKPPHSDQMRSDWARFLMSLYHRSPRKIRRLQDEVRAKRAEIVASIKAQHIEARDMSDDEIFSLPDTDRAYVKLVRDLVHSDRVGSHLVQMRWSILRLPNTSHPLLSSDRPLMQSDGIQFDESFIMLPLGPRAIFLAVNDRRIRDALSDLPIHKLISTVNHMVVSQAEEFVVAFDETQTRFIDNRLMRGKVSRNPAGDVSWKLG